MNEVNAALTIEKQEMTTHAEDFDNEIEIN